MGRRTRLGIYFTYNENWIGGTYYIINVIEALKTLSDDLLPEIYFVAKEQTDLDIAKKIEYPYARYLIFGANQKKEVLKKILNRITSNKLTLTTNSKIVSLDMMFPYESNIVFSKIKNRLCWVPDFQEKYLPNFFSPEEIKGRDKECQRIAYHEKNVVFSSQDALDDFNKFYPDSTAKKFKLNFAVTHPDYKHLNIDRLKEKYNLKGKYFFSPNQFWIHKNQIVILKAMKLLKESGHLNFQIAFSGKEYDYRNPDYFTSLKNYVSENNLSENVRFLGFIDRNDQLQLMKNAEAIIQPSLFEGWSTVIEDGKAMNQYIITSDLNVNREQLGNSARFFDPKNPEALAELLTEAMSGKKIRYTEDYKINIGKFGSDFIKIINEIIS